MYTIQLNEKGSHNLQITTKNLETIDRYALFRDLVDSHGYVNEAVLDKLKLNIRALIARSTEDTKDLLDLCIDVIYHNKMKAYGLHNLIILYLNWKRQSSADQS